MKMISSDCNIGFLFKSRTTNPNVRFTNKVELLLNNGAPINAGLDRDGGSVLHHSVKAGNLEVVEALLENKVFPTSILAQVVVSMI